MRTLAFQHQPALPRRLVPNTVAGVSRHEGAERPHSEVQYTGSFRSGRECRLVLEHEPNIVIGLRQEWGKPFPIGLSPADRRQHVYVTGKTGVGKTTLLQNMIVQHIANDDGVGLIDPHGDLAEELLNHIPARRAKHLCYFNPGDLEFPVGMNPLWNVPPDDRHLVASGIISAFKGIWADSWGPRLEYILYNAVAALLDCNNVTLLGVNRLLTDASFRQSVIRQIEDPFIRAFWAEEYEGYDERFRREAIAPIQNKIGQFVLNPLIRNILGQVKSRVDIPFVIDNQRLFIANLSKGRVGDDKANLLGSLLVTQFQLAAMRRVTRPETERRHFYLFIDEFQNFSTDSFASILAEARKYRLCLTLSHQYIDQLSLPVRQAVFGNVASFIVFRVGHSDAEILHKEFGEGIPPSSLTGLDRYEAIVKLLQNGVQCEPFRARTLPPAAGKPLGRDKLIARSREQFTTPRTQVKARLHRWLAINEARNRYNPSHK
jgi:Type IV secretion-system coupling protein DNA-binding domain